MRLAFIIANNGYQDTEYLVPKEFLSSQGHVITTVATSLGEATGSLGGTATINLTLEELNVQEFDAIVFIGGPGASVYQDDSKVNELIKETLVQAKLLAAICIAPMTLAKAGALRGKNATVWNGDTLQAAIFENYGAKYFNENVVQDENIITANGPHAAKDFARAILNYLNLNSNITLEAQE